MRGRDRERSALAGWPDDHEADLYRDDSPVPEPGSPNDPPAPGIPDDRDPQHGIWEGWDGGS